MIPDQKLIIDVKGHPKSMEHWHDVVLPAVKKSPDILGGWLIALWYRPDRDKVRSMEALMATIDIQADFRVE